ncbi:MAG: carboxypeptidase-like regulatory domain-containing protein [Saprospiraceae bacterium]|nr:carboxypeptidase-like regulatory domain-containing protein [Saprospiraceae bacterium]
MKGIVLLLLVLFGLTTTLLSQTLEELRIKGDYVDRPLHLVLLDLEINYRLNFQFNSDELRQHKITLTFRRAPFSEVMTQLLQETGLQYNEVGHRTFKISRKTDQVPIVQSEVQPSRQNVTTSGVVKDGATGESLPFANVSILGTTNGTETNTEGYFTLFNVPTDTAILTINYGLSTGLL